MLLLALLLTQQYPPIVMTLLRPATSRITQESSCVRNYFMIEVDGDEFVSRLVSATVNGKQVRFISGSGDLAVVQAGHCDDKGDLNIAIGGVDMNKSSSSFGNDVLFRFHSKTRR